MWFYQYGYKRTCYTFDSVIPEATTEPMTPRQAVVGTVVQWRLLLDHSLTVVTAVTLDDSVCHYRLNQLICP